MIDNLKAGIGCLGTILVLGLLALVFSTTTVPPGAVGVVVNLGKVEENTLPSGFHFITPFLQSVHVMDTKVQSHEFGVADNAPIEAASREYQSVYLSGKFNYHVDGQYASVLFKTVGVDFASRIIDPAFKDIVKEIVPNYGIAQVLPKRDEIRTKTIEKLNENLARYHIVIDDVYFANIGFSPEYEAAIEAKQVAEQQVETEKQITQQRIQQANQREEEAKGNARATIAAAQGTATANKLITDSLTPLLIQYESIRLFNPKAQVIYLPESGNFLLQVPQPAQATNP